MLKTRPSIAAILVLSFLLLMPWAAVATDRLDGHDLARCAQVLLALCCAIRLAVWPPAWPGSVTRFQGAVVAAWCTLAILSVASAPNVDAASRELGLFLSMTAVTFVMAEFLALPRGGDILSLTIVTASALYATLVLALCVWSLIDGKAPDRFDVFTGYESVRFFNHVQTPLLPLLSLALSRVSDRRSFAALGWYALVTQFCLLIFSIGRATALGLVVGVAISLLLLGRTAAPWARRFAVGASLGTLTFAVVFVLLPWVLGIPLSMFAADGVAGLGSDHSRGMLWRLAERQIIQSPMLGIGPMHFAHEINGKAAHPHNVYLQVAAEWGLPVLVLTLGFAGRGLFRLVRVLRGTVESRQAEIGVALLVAVVAVAVDGAFSGNFVMPVSQVWIAVLLGWSVAWMRANAVPREKPVVTLSVPRWVRTSALSVLCASQIWLCWACWTDPRDTNGRVHLAGAAPTTTGKLAPRFWAFGWF